MVFAFPLRVLTLSVLFATVGFTFQPLRAEESTPPASTTTDSQSESGAKSAPAVEEFRWFTDYAEAVTAAQKSHKMLFVWFYSTKFSQAETDFAHKTVTDANVHARLRNTVAVCIPTDATMQAASGPITVLRHQAFSALHCCPGVAVVDYTNERGPYYARVVSAYPYRGRPMSTGELATLLDLPPGSLTQRTLIMAVRMHPEAPASTRGHADPYLHSEAEAHSNHMASIRVQGHHNFDTRFQRMTATMSGGLAAKEVCAESWPGQGMIEAAEELVHSWRQSSGHWSAVRNHHAAYGYDMKLGSNGIWYGTGIFAAARD